MNILPLTKTIKLAAISLALTAFAAPALAADGAPQFSVQSTATRSIASSATAFNKGDYSKSAAYSRHALEQGLKKSRRTIAYSNLCAALGAQGQYDKALDACDSALKASPQNWQAFSNRAAVNWLAGDKTQAMQDISSAQQISPDAPVISYNLEVLG